MKASEAYQQGNFSHLNWHWNGCIATVTVITTGNEKASFQILDEKNSPQILEEKIINDGNFKPAVANFERKYEAPRKVIKEVEVKPDENPDEVNPKQQGRETLKKHKKSGSIKTKGEKHE